MTVEMQSKHFDTHLLTCIKISSQNLQFFRRTKIKKRIEEERREQDFKSFIMEFTVERDKERKTIIDIVTTGNIQWYHHRLMCAFRSDRFPSRP